MTEQESNLLSFYRNIVTDDFVCECLEELGQEYRTRVFNSALVVWLMIYQRLDSSHTLSKVVERLTEGEFDELLSGRKGELLSTNTSGYSRARKRIPSKLVEAASDRINEALIELHKEQKWEGYKIYLLDGSAWTLPGTNDLKQVYPPCENQYGESHWPKLRTLHAHDLMTGVALRPEYGPMYGEESVGEITLLPALLERLPGESVIVADRLFGCFRVAYQLCVAGSEYLFRLTNDRAQKFLKEMKKPGEIEVSWTPSKHERRKYKDLSEDAAVTGRFIWFRLRRKGYRSQDYYFFTTLPFPAEKIMELYSLRWDVEIDLRSIKSTMDLAQIEGKSPDIVGKELILGHVAYNLVCHIRALIGQLAKVEPRTISFTRILNFIVVIAPKLLTASKKDIARRFSNVVRKIKDYQHPTRNNRKAEPRKVLFRRPKYAYLKIPREIEREMIQIKRLAA